MGDVVGVGELLRYDHAPGVGHELAHLRLTEARHHGVDPLVTLIAGPVQEETARLGGNQRRALVPGKAETHDRLVGGDGRVHDPAAREALKQAQARINALALVHRILHEIEDMTTVEVKQLLGDLAEQTYEGFAGNRPELKVELDLIERQVSGNLAVPLALFTVEALTNVFKHAYPGDARGGKICVSLKPCGKDELRLAISDDGEGYASEAVERSVGARMIQTFGRQVGGHSGIRSVPGEGTVAELVFPDPAIHRGEDHLYGEP